MPSSFVFVPAISVSTRPSAVVLGSVPLSPLQLFAKELEETMNCVEKYEGEEEREEKKKRHEEESEESREESESSQSDANESDSEPEAPAFRRRVSNVQENRNLGSSQGTRPCYRDA